MRTRGSKAAKLAQAVASVQAFATAEVARIAEVAGAALNRLLPGVDDVTAWIEAWSGCPLLDFGDCSYTVPCWGSGHRR